MSPLGQLYAHDLPSPPGARRYALAVACAGGCAHVERLHTTSQNEAADRLRDAGWLHVRGRGRVCGECAAQARERALMGVSVEVGRG
jgi:hypothetical protein